MEERRVAQMKFQTLVRLAQATARRRAVFGLVAGIPAGVLTLVAD